MRLEFTRLCFTFRELTREPLILSKELSSEPLVRATKERVKDLVSMKI
jgi:hypothetical protein